MEFNFYVLQIVFLAYGHTVCPQISGEYSFFYGVGGSISGIGLRMQKARCIYSLTLYPVFSVLA